MATATSVEISAIKPDGTGDYTTLAAWWTAKRSSATVAAWAECYSGDPGVGPLTIASGSASYTPVEDYYTRVYPAEGHWHDGIKASGVGAYLTNTDDDGIYVRDHPYCRIEGLRVSITSAVNAKSGIYIQSAAGSDSHEARINGCLIEVNGTAQTLRGIWSRGRSYKQHEVRRLYNNIVYMISGGSYSEGVQCSCEAWTTAKAEITHYAYNNSVNNTLANGAGFMFYTLGTGGDGRFLNVNSSNNSASHGSGRPSYWSKDVGDTNTQTIVQDYCISSDASADDWETVAGSNLVSQTMDDVWVTPASDLHLESAGPAVGVGVNLYTSLPTDGIGVARSRSGAWDIGAFAIPLPDMTVFFRDEDTTLRRRKKIPIGQLLYRTYNVPMGIPDANVPSRGDVMPGTSGLTAPSVLRVGKAQAAGKGCNAIELTWIEPEAMSGVAAAGNYQEIRTSRKVTPSANSRRAVCVGVSSDLASIPNYGDFYPGDSGLLGMKCIHRRHSQEVVPGLYFAVSYYMAFRELMT